MSTSAAAAGERHRGRFGVVGELDDRVGADRGERFEPRAGPRPAPTTRPAPSRLAICTAIAPALPVAPRTRTPCPRIGTRHRSATHDDIAGFIAAATFATSASWGSSIERRTSTERTFGHRAERVVVGHEVDQPLRRAL